METENNMQNLGSLFKEQKSATKYGDKLEKLQEQIKDGKTVLKGILLTDDTETAKFKVTAFINLMYANPKQQLDYLSKKQTTEEVVQQAYNIMLQKQETLRKTKDSWEQELSGI